MPKKGGPQRSARDIQTPASDRESTSPKPETSAATKDPATTAPATTAPATTAPATKTPATTAPATTAPAATAPAATAPATIAPANTGKTARFNRDPTRQDDFAPGEISDNHDSNDETDSDLENESDQDAPIEHRPNDVGRWVKDLIRSKAAGTSVKGIEQYFIEGGLNNPTLDEECIAFFQGLNQEIRAANEKHDAIDLDNGVINERYYVDMCRTWQAAHDKAKFKNDMEGAWDAFNKTHALIRMFNKRHYLPKGWNISQAWTANDLKCENPKMIDDSDDAASLSGAENQQAGTLKNESESEDEATYLEELQDLDDLEDLDALEARTKNEQRRMSSGKVLYWWPKGTGSQTFIRYGDRHTPIYRIRAGSHQSYNRHEVDCVLTTKTRGNVKRIRMRNGLEEEYWKWDRRQIKNILGVGWKLSEDDENDLDPLALLRPEKGVIYPETRTLVKWKDNVLTLEGRAFMRRVTSGSALDGDRVLYQKACEMENSYRKIHGLDEFESDNDGGFIEEVRPRRNTRRQKDQTSSEDDTDSDHSFRPSYNRGRKQSESGRRRSAQPKRANDEKIRSLERQLRQLRMDNPVSPHRSHAKPRRRERTA
ncbi:uncharacterized protein N7484_000263 [Penicillium longicatenatum]|uniref:uncharacterized protein n=1 Tax=Penicillium longicatenatum TaxID=1561947 RepID=UPI002547DBAD|nr:uncharacterized protein N7484_000263 [Penicillium longicatenatum]KAJ5660891.1 hypothetical protein N7484_000263 [Penicillium longicatenatum]